MMSFEQVIDIFGDYLALDTEMEVCKSRYGYIPVSYTHLKQKDSAENERGKGALIWDTLPLKK